MKQYTENEVMKLLRDKMSPPQGHTQKEIAAQLGFSPQFLCDVLGGRRHLTDALAESLGFRRIVQYVRKMEKES